MVDLFGLHIEMCQHVEYNGRVDAAAAGAHEGSLQGRKPHAGIDTPAVFHGGDAAAIPQVTGDQFELGQGAIQASGSFPGNKLMTRAMESIPPDTVIFIHGMGQSIQIGMFGQGGMKRRVKYGHLGELGENAFTCLDSLQIRRIVQWG